jgi:hypothetical protein
MHEQDYNKLFFRVDTDIAGLMVMLKLMRPIQVELRGFINHSMTFF